MIDHYKVNRLIEILLNRLLLIINWILICLIYNSDYNPINYYFKMSKSKKIIKYQNYYLKTLQDKKIGIKIEWILINIPKSLKI